MESKTSKPHEVTKGEKDIHIPATEVTLGRVLTDIFVEPPLTDVGADFCSVILGPNPYDVKLRHVGSTNKRTSFIVDAPESRYPEIVTVEDMEALPSDTPASIVAARIDTYINGGSPAELSQAEAFPRPGLQL